MRFPHYRFIVASSCYQFLLILRKLAKLFEKNFTYLEKEIEYSGYLTSIRYKQLDTKQLVCGKEECFPPPRGNQ